MKLGYDWGPWWHGEGFETTALDHCGINVHVYTAYGHGAGNTVEENSSVFSLIRMR